MPKGLHKGEFNPETPVISIREDFVIAKIATSRWSQTRRDPNAINRLVGVIHAKRGWTQEAMPV
jgi:hypothetical protein